MGLGRKSVQIGAGWKSVVEGKGLGRWREYRKGLKYNVFFTGRWLLEDARSHLGNQDKNAGDQIYFSLLEGLQMCVGAASWMGCSACVCVCGSCRV